MSARIRIGGLEATIDDELVWTLASNPDVARDFEGGILQLLNRNYGREWRPPFGVEEPSWPNAAARDAVDELGAEMIEELPLPPVLPGRVY